MSLRMSRTFGDISKGLTKAAKHIVSNNAINPLSEGFWNQHGNRMLAGAGIGMIGGAGKAIYDRDDVLRGGVRGATVGAIGGLGSSMWSGAGGYSDIKGQYSSGAIASTNKRLGSQLRKTTGAPKDMVYRRHFR